MRRSPARSGPLPLAVRNGTRYRCSMMKTPRPGPSSSSLIVTRSTCGPNARARTCARSSGRPATDRRQRQFIVPFPGSSPLHDVGRDRRRPEGSVGQCAPDDRPDQQKRRSRAASSIRTVGSPPLTAEQTAAPGQDAFGPDDDMRQAPSSANTSRTRTLAVSSMAGRDRLAGRPAVGGHQHGVQAASVGAGAQKFRGRRGRAIGSPDPTTRRLPWTIHDAHRHPVRRMRFLRIRLHCLHSKRHFMSARERWIQRFPLARTQ